MNQDLQIFLQLLAVKILWCALNKKKIFFCVLLNHNSILHGKYGTYIQLLSIHTIDIICLTNESNSN